MLINLRNALMAGKRLPYDAEVEYLECAGTSSAFPYINTGIVGDSNTTYEAMLWRNTQSSNECAVGSWNSGNTRCWIAYYFGNKFYLGMGAHGNSAGTPQPNVWYKQTLRAESSNFNLYVDDALTATVPQTTFTSSQPLYIGAMNSSGTASFYFRGRFGAVKIWQNGVLVRDFIPVRKGTVGYLYDRVSGKLFGNAGTGDFVLGPDVVPVEWLEADNVGVRSGMPLRCVIDTGIIPDINEDVWKCDAQFVQFGDTAGCWGCTGNRFAFGRGSISWNDWYFGLGNTNNRTGASYDNNRHIFILDGTDKKLSIDSSTYNGAGSAVSGISASIALFARNSEYGITYRYDALKSRCYISEYYRNGVILQKLIPVRVGTDATSWEGAMMDVLTRRVYRNAGTGAFTYGNDLKYPIPAS